MQCPNCGHEQPARPDLRLTPMLALRLGLFTYGILCWVVIIVSAIQNSGPRGAPLTTPPPPPAGLMANPLLQGVIIVGAMIAFGMVLWESITTLRTRGKHRCEACGHVWG